MEAINHGVSAIAIRAANGVVLAAEKRILSKLLEVSKSSEKMYKVDDHVACSVAGLTSDANILISEARAVAQRYALTYQQPIPVEQLVQLLCDDMQAYTQFGGLRPFGASFLFAGYDHSHGWQLYQSDPSGNYAAWKATAIGANNQSAQATLKQEYDSSVDVDSAVKLAVRVLIRTMDSTSLSPDKLEVVTHRHDEAKGGIQQRMLSAEELKPACDEATNSVQSEMHE
jgi:20S proteasome subunit alpha 3